MIGRAAEEVLNRAVHYAFERRHEYFTLEHVLLSLLEDPEILEIIQACGGSYIDIKKELEEYLAKEMPPLGEKELGGTSSTQKQDQESTDPEEMMDHPVATLSIQRMIQRALFHVQSAGKDEIQPEDLFVALFQAKNSFVLHLLSKQRIERLDVLNYISHGSSKTGSFLDETPEEQGVVSKPDVQLRKRREGPDPLKQYATNLNTLAKEGRIDDLVGREIEMERVIRTLCRRQKNNPLLVGEAGVGKTAIAEGLALKIVNKEVPSLLEKAEVFSLDLGSMLAGAKFRGDFEQRFKRVLQAIEDKKKDGLYPVLFIDEIHTIIGAGAVSGGAMDAANLLKPLLSKGQVRCIGSTTYNEYRSIFEKDHALARRFQKIDVKEPSLDEAIQILKGLRPKYEEHHEITYTDEAISSAVHLSSKHLTDRFLPDKAIDVMDEAGARARLERASSPNSRSSMVNEEAIEEIVAQIARIPTRSVSKSQKDRLKNLERDLKLTIFGQDPGIDALVTSIRLARSGLRTGDRPVGAFLFCGPTGVGKTELTKQLANCLGVPFLRFDMSEYMEKHTVSRLIGAPPGYVGFEQSGLLTDAVLKNPHSVILLDEIEKAHSDIWNILLQVMDHGTLTDNNGRKADFRNAIIVMTSNVGTREAERRPLGMQTQTDRTSVSKQEIERAFSPEFRNRLDSIVYFNSLDPVTIAQVVDKQLMELENQLLEKGVEIDLDTDVREWLGHKGYDAKLGARPLARLIQNEVKKPLSEEILFGRLEHGGRVKLGVKNGALTFEFYARSDSKLLAPVTTGRND